jgi:hypothetical protein
LLVIAAAGSIAGNGRSAITRQLRRPPFGMSRADRIDCRRARSQRSERRALPGRSCSSHRERPDNSGLAGGAAYGRFATGDDFEEGGTLFKVSP